MDPAKVAIAMKNYEAQLQRCRDYWRRKNPNPKPRGRPRKEKVENTPPENEKAEVVEKV
jgi:hypothetical protein